MRHLLRKNPINFFITLAVILSAIIYCADFFLNTANNSASAQTTSRKDAIAIRVIPNPEHYSPLRWYKNQGFTGSPQSLTVDGYEAIRDGRTIYVNAANIVNNVLYTNIYLISYNQDAEKETTDIFSKILKNWKFNTNVPGVGNCSNRAATTDCSKTVGCWTFEGDFLDHSPNNYASTENGGVSFATGINGQAASFDGVDDWILLDGFNAGKYYYRSNTSNTFSVWVKGTNGYIYSEAQNAVSPPWAFIRSSGKKINIEYIVGSYDGARLVSNADVFDGSWHNIVVTDDSKVVKIYVDGTLDASVNSDRLALPGSFSGISRAAIGAMRRAATGGFFKGLMDNVKIYDYVLSPTDIANEFNLLSDHCMNDGDCPANEYCLSNKANVTRDTIRLSRLVELNLALEEYKNKNGHYPKLESGTYLPNTSVSTWPSWQETLGKELGINLPVDPINQLGNCPNYDKNTCWDKDKKKFADADSADPSLNPPLGSDVFIYSALANGSGYSSCAVMDSGFITGAGAGACSGSAGVTYGGATTNNPPVFTGSNLTGYSGEVFTGYLAASDADGDFITWSIDTAVTPSWLQWSAAPALQNTALANQKKLYSAHAGRAGSYNVSVTINDGRGEVNSVITKNYTINIINIPPIISASNYTYTASSTVPIDYKLTASDSTSNYPLSYSLTFKTIDIAILNDTFALINTPAKSYYEFRRYNPPAPWGNTFNSSSSLNPFIFTIAVGDIFGATSTKDFTITVINKAPQLTIPPSCGDDIRINNPYACQLSAIDPENNNYKYYWVSGFSPVPGLDMDFVTGLISGAPTAQNIYNVGVAVADEYNFVTQNNYSLKVNTYCGDGVKQTPNTEGQGGPTNNGQEECDNTDGVASSPAASSINRTYACTTQPAIPNSYCILGANCAGTCSWLYGPQGGYCGDGIVQDGTGGTIDFGEQCDDGNAVDGDGCNTLTANCQFVCGDGALNIAGETCDPPGQVQNCLTPSGMPTYCTATITGTQTCAPNCTWGVCISVPPSLTGNTTPTNSTSCNTLNIVLSNYSCCELTTCYQDKCDCCGRGAGVIHSGYTNMQNMKVTWRVGAGSGSFSYCGEALGAGNSPNNACRLNRSDANNRDWEVTTNHSTLEYQCWD